MRTYDTVEGPGIGKVIMLIGVFECGGAERQVYLLANELKRRHGLDVEAWALKFPGSYSSTFEAAGIATRVLNFRAPNYAYNRPSARLARIPFREMMSIDPRYPLRWVHRLWRISRQLNEARADVILPFTTWPNVIAGLTWRSAGARACIWGERACGGERVAGFERVALWQTPRFAANSSAGVEYLARELQVPRRRISFIPNGVEKPRIDPAINWRERLGLSASQAMVVKVATISTFKDHMTLLRAWKQVQDAWNNSERPVLALAGAFYETYEDCRRFVSGAGLESTVRFLGRVSEIPELLDASDIGAFSSPAEGMPNAVLECMAAGRAIVSTDLPGVRDALGPGAEGVVIPPGDAHSFARALLDLLGNSAKRRQLGELNRARIRAEFSVERMGSRYLDVIRSELAHSRRRAQALPGSWKAQNVPE